ncbi:MAG: CcmD family protein [Bacillota bacterium]|nr:CcmD family protein [Bacillota bacterium]
MGWVALAYGVIWLGLAGYVVRLALATRRLEEEVGRLSSMLPEEEATVSDAARDARRGAASRQEGGD